MKKLAIILGVTLLAVSLQGCGGGGANKDTDKKGEELTGEIKVDGSSTVYLITEAMATKFKKQNPKVNITVGISGTGGGFKKFSTGETDIQDASRKIKPAEDEKCKANKIDYLELQVGWDGLAVIIHKDNTWARNLTVEQLKKIWHPASVTNSKTGETETYPGYGVKKWSDVDPSWPKEPIALFGAGPDSGTFDYFTEVINGKEKVIRTDYGASEDDNDTINGVVKNKYGMGFLGLAYYVVHKDKLTVVHVAEKAGAPFIEPTPETVLAHQYRPLGRPLFIYVRTSALERPEVREFANFYMRRGDLVAAAKYVQLSEVQQQGEQDKLAAVLKKIKK